MEKGFYAVRLREYNPRKKHHRLTYTSFHAGTKYRAGEGGFPSPFVIVTDEQEIKKLRTIDQFEIIECKDRAQLDEIIRREAEERHRSRGIPSVRAEVHGSEEKAKPKRRSLDILKTVSPPQPMPEAPQAMKELGEDEEEDLTGGIGDDDGLRPGGRKPASSGAEDNVSEKSIDNDGLATQETVPHTVSDTVSDTVSHTVPDTVPHTVSHTVSDTVSGDAEEDGDTSKDVGDSNTAAAPKNKKAASKKKAPSKKKTGGRKGKKRSAKK